MTMIEVLVVLALIGLSAGAVIFALPSGAPARSVTQEAALLATRLNLAVQRSLIEGRHYRLEWSNTGYRFVEWQAEGWRDAAGPPLSEPHILAGGATLTDGNGARNGALRMTPDVLPPADGIVQLQVAGGAITQTVQFDGATAQIGNQTQ